jgi:acyl-CoA thioester hydrolase
MSKDEGLLTYRGVVYPWQCDHIGHMNVMWYTAKFDEATWNLLAECGITARYIRDNKRGMGAVQQNTTYKKELMAGDVVTIRTVILEVREKVARFRHDMFNNEDGQIAASTELTGVHMDQETRKSTPFPEDILKKLQSMVQVTA